MSNEICNKCNGSGLIENKNKFCINCFGYKCNNILFRSKYHPYYECPKCFTKGNIILNNHFHNCEECKGYGLIKFKSDECVTCNPSHKYCFCNNYIEPLKTCNFCNGCGKNIFTSN